MSAQFDGADCTGVDFCQADLSGTSWGAARHLHALFEGSVWGGQVLTAHLFKLMVLTKASSYLAISWSSAAK